MDISDDLVVVAVPVSLLRSRFNASDIGRQIVSGELRPDSIVQERHLKNPESRRMPEPFCTRHQMMRYLDTDGVLILETSQYLRADGSLGASGLPDPKRMRVGNEMWIKDERES
ncbi:MAG: hypothetical protein BZY80_01150 [SAR202 cluster bacterium Io17-Chloro-G2]|nr:MAG: hypothetical protein BZY80_01150 [SAR202 cluster bacterium Io17-Chloro-G2]